MTLVEKLGIEDFSCEGLEEKMGFGNWLKRKMTGADIEFDPNKRKNMEGIAAATIVIGGGLNLIPNEAEAKKLPYIITNEPENVQFAYLYRYKLADYHDSKGTTRSEAYRAILGLFNRDIGIPPVADHVRKTSPVYAVLRASVANPINEKEIEKAQEAGNIYWKNQVLGINKFFERDFERSREYFSKNIFEIANLGPKEFEQISKAINIKKVKYDSKISPDENNRNLAVIFNDINDDERGWILNEIVYKHIINRRDFAIPKSNRNKNDPHLILDLKNPNGEYNPKNPNLKWKNFYVSLGLLSLIEENNAIINHRIAVKYGKESLYDKLGNKFDYSSFKYELLGIKVG